MTIIKNAKDTPINVQTGTVPNVNAAMANWFQPMTFGVVEKNVDAFQVVETMINISFQGVIQPLTGRRLMLKPEGQRAWTWLWLHADPSLVLQVDSVVTYLGKQTRVMAQKNYAIYGYVEYELVQDWTGAGPEVDSITVYNNGDAESENFAEELNGGDADVTGPDINGGGAFVS